MNRGIYIVANDRVKENAIALLNSIRCYDQNVPVILIPFNEQHQSVAETLMRSHNVQLFPDLTFVDQFTQTIGEIFDRDFLALPNKMRKLVAWFGPLDQFLYIDTDIIVFEKIANVLDYLSDYEFLCCDYHHKSEGLKDIFSPLVREEKIFNEEQLADVFNSGFWGSRKSVFSEEQMYGLLRECAAHREYFDFSRQTTDQPIMNYLILKATQKRLNLVKLPDKATGSWAGSKHFEERDHILYDHGKRLQYLHWAGTPMKPGGAYWDLWEHYRYLNEPKPAQVATHQTQNFLQRLIKKVKSQF